ncbi:unnamed protein product [Parascedosporium putredinis]|uniref:chorismate synthase n=1 Tax=Parascedosporium putredinis TaxID=1442378 RepID=A0A9P1H7C6_9PEZI|nr:unnamed protein product [Parascedosporium putredinis]CAI7999735.1 unnamed protein product [Parascedosporium putredinis]
MSTFGTVFRVTTFGESHGKAPQLNRRRPGQSAITTPRDEKDRVTIQSGTEFGKTLGTPISLVVMNEDQRPKDYGNKTMDVGGGRSSARETIARVAAGAVAEKFLLESYGVEIVAFVSSVGHVELYPETAEHPSRSLNPAFMGLLESITKEHVDTFLPVRCPDKEATDQMTELITNLRDASNSTGGTVTCVIRNVPSGLGEPAFDKLEALIGHAMMSIPAVKAFEIGSGFSGTKMLGSQHNDPFGRLQAPATIGIDQTTANYEGSTEGVLAAKGRHDPCVVPRAVPIVEGMAALAIMDALAIQQSRHALSAFRR